MLGWIYLLWPPVTAGLLALGWLAGYNAVWGLWKLPWLPSLLPVLLLVPVLVLAWQAVRTPSPLGARIADA